MTREMLDDLLMDVPRQVVPDVAGAWRAGGRRRRHRYVGAAVVVVVAALAVGTGVLSSHAAVSVSPADGAAGVDGHPTSVPRPLSVPMLPQRPGPMAGVFSPDDEHWYVASEDGRSWRVPGVAVLDSFQPALSDDGTHLGWLRQEAGGEHAYVVRDLVSGEQEVFSEIGDNAGRITEDYWLQGQIPSHWAPDNSYLLLLAQANRSDQATAVLVGMDGDLRPIPRVGTPVGWRGTDRIVWLEDDGNLRTTDLDGNEVARVHVPVTRTDGLSQWTARVSPDGSQIAVQTEGVAGLWTYATYEVDTGGLVTSRNDLDGPVSFATPMWAGDRPVAWLGGELVDVNTDVRVLGFSGVWTSQGEIEGQLAGYWAADALAGDVHGTARLMLDWRYWSFLWWWREILIGLAIIALAGFLAVLLRREHRRPSPPRRGPDTVDWWGGDPA